MEGQGKGDDRTHMTKETIERRMFVEHSIVWRAEFFNADGRAIQTDREIFERCMRQKYLVLSGQCKGKDEIEYSWLDCIAKE